MRKCATLLLIFAFSLRAMDHAEDTIVCALDEWLEQNLLRPEIYIIPTPYEDPVLATYLSDSSDFKIELTSKGNLYVSGNNDYGQLGLGHRDAVENRTLLKGPWNKIVAVTIFEQSVFARTDSDEVYVWGKNSFGQLGLGDDIDRLYPNRYLRMLNFNPQAVCIAETCYTD